MRLRRQHRNLQSHHCGARGSDCQKTLPEPHNEVDFVVHVFAPPYIERFQVALPADTQQTDYLIDR
jgi:hypothetical protein